jgi:energy-coupling factor transporter ATP-binding protein EcfA2
MENIKVKSLGPIQEADINFGDLTLFVGPQASGKSILLQLIKLITDKNNIETKLENYGFVWGNNLDDNLERFFGEGVSGAWNKRTDIRFDGNSYSKSFLGPQKKTGELFLDREKTFYIPAQRVLCLNYGWPRFFKDFDDSVPYVLRDFSETLRQYLEIGFTHGESPIFPQKLVTHNYLTHSFNDSIFHGGEITVDLITKKRLKLNIDDLSLPFMTWSTGQKEFMPLLLAFKWLYQTKSVRKKKGVNYVIIEEPEMGLHPEAIKSVILQIMDLVARGYRVIVSTHSPLLLEFAWAFNILKTEKAPSTAFDALFDIHVSDKFNSFFDDNLIDKNIKTYYFNRVNENVTVKDISSLDANSEDLAVAEWGGLSSFSSKANDIVSSIAATNG